MMKEARFDIWCEKCKYKDTPEQKDPCNLCLALNGYSEQSTKPANFVLNDKEEK